MAVDQTAEGGTLVALPTQGGTQGEDTEKSLAAMLRAQYLSREFNDVFSATELREHEVIIIAGMFMVRFITMIMATADKEEEGLDVISNEYKNIHARIQIRNRIMTDPNAMVFAEVDSWLYAFGLSRISLKRQSRQEGMHVSTASLLRQLGVDGGDIGFGQKFLSKLGVGPYRTAYIPKEKK